MMILQAGVTCPVCDRDVGDHDSRQLGYCVLALVTDPADRDAWLVAQHQARYDALFGRLMSVSR